MGAPSRCLPAEETRSSKPNPFGDARPRDDRFRLAAGPLAAGPFPRSHRCFRLDLCVAALSRPPSSVPSPRFLPPSRTPHRGGGGIGRVGG